MEKFFKIKWFRSYNNNDNLKPYDIRTYTTEHLLHISILFIVLCFFWNTLFNLCHTTNFVWAFKYSFIHKNEYYEFAKQKFNFVLYSSLAISTFISLFTVNKHSYSTISENSKFFFFKDLKKSNYDFHKRQTENIIDGKNKKIKMIELLNHKDCFKKGFRITKYCFPISIKEELFNFALLLTGQAGSGKSVFFTWYYQSIIKNNHKLIVHSPDVNVLKLFINAGVKSYICAPWLKEGYKLDLLKTIKTDDKNLQNSLIDILVTSFHGQKSQKKEEFFNEGARAILISGLRKAVLYSNNNDDLLANWIKETSNINIKDYKVLVQSYLPEAGAYISEDAEKMTASILASMSNTLIKIGKLSAFYQEQKNKFDIKEFIYDK